MPTCRRKRVVLVEPSRTILQLAENDSGREVHYLPDTGEIFDSYELYASRMSFYKLKQFQCEVTGKGGLDYFQAVRSEQFEARTLHSRFPEPLKAAVLRAVQWRVMGRLDHLVDSIYDRFKDRYFVDEKIYVDIEGDKVYAKVVTVIPPQFNSTQYNHDEVAPESRGRSTAVDAVHAVGVDLSVPSKEARVRDDPEKYLYKLQTLDCLTDENAQKGGDFIEVHCTSMSRDRLAFSKSILRRFIRDCVERDAAIASPWVVKPDIAKRYGVGSVMTEETRKGVEEIKKGEIDKRKKAAETKDAPPPKKPRLIKGDDEIDAKEQNALDTKAGRESTANLECSSAVKKKKPLRYPTEDLDISLTEKDKKLGTKLQKPIPSRVGLPCGEDEYNFEDFLMTWNFLVVYGQPLHLSAFTMDEFEHAIEHTAFDSPCQLLAEVHATLIYNLRSVPFTRHSALISLLRCGEDPREPELVHGVSLEQLTTAMGDVGNNWERTPLRHADTRGGWEEALFGCLKDHATVEKFPRLREVLTRLLFGNDPVSEPGPSVGTHSPLRQNYHALSAADRVAILSVMCNVAASSKAIHSHMEACEEQLTALRKEKIEVNRLKKQYAGNMNALAYEAHSTRQPEISHTTSQDSSDLSDIPSDNDPTHETRRSYTQVPQLDASANEAHRIDEEVSKLDRRLDGIERDFRKLLGAVRVKPLGKDRFHNRIWWFDGLGSTSLVGNGGTAQYGSGRIFVQGPSTLDAELMARRRDDPSLDIRREEEEGVCVLGVGEWAVYTSLEELHEFMAWLNPKGVRELALKNNLTKWWSYILAGIRKRLADINVNAKLLEARRSKRGKTVAAGQDISREPYMMWTNRRTVSAS